MARIRYVFPVWISHPRLWETLTHLPPMKCLSVCCSRMDRHIFWRKIRIFLTLHMLYYRCRWNSTTLLYFSIVREDGRVHQAGPPYTALRKERKSIAGCVESFSCHKHLSPKLLCINACSWQHPSGWCRISASCFVLVRLQLLSVSTIF